MHLGVAIIAASLLPLAPPPSPAGSPPPPVTILVEGVAATAAAAPIAALRGIWERVVGVKFSILEGKYAELGEGAPPPSMDTRRKRLVAVKEISNGLFRALLEVEAPSELVRAQDRMQEVTAKGEAEIASSGSLPAARELAREDALKKAALAAAAEIYPPTSVPQFLEGRIIYLETLSEGAEEGRYRLTARVKVELASP